MLYSSFRQNVHFSPTIWGKKVTRRNILKTGTITAGAVLLVGTGADASTRQRETTGSRTPPVHQPATPPPPSPTPEPPEKPKDQENPPNERTCDASSKIMHIDQFDDYNYSSPQAAAKWKESACNAAAHLAVWRAWGKHNDTPLDEILEFEYSQMVERDGNGNLLRDATPEYGILLGAGPYQRVAKKFGFTCDYKNSDERSFATVINIVHRGIPIITGIATSPYYRPYAHDGTPLYFDYGHILVLRGGTDENVEVVDSSAYNLRELPLAEFLAMWTGWSNVSVPVPAYPGHPHFW